MWSLVFVVLLLLSLDEPRLQLLLANAHTKTNYVQKSCNGKIVILIRWMFLKIAMRVIGNITTGMWFHV